MSTVNLSNKGLTSFVGINIPEGTTNFDCSYNNITSFDGLVLPNSLREFSCYNNQITNFNGLVLPNSLIHFNCSHNQITSFDGLVLKDSSLTYFNCSHNQITSFDGLVLPNSLIELNCAHNQITSLNGLVIPNSLIYFFYYNNPLSKEYLNKNGRIKTKKELNEITYIWRFRKGLEKINSIINNSRIQNLQTYWKNYWLTPTFIDGYDYPVSRYMIHYRYQITHQ